VPRPRLDYLIRLQSPSTPKYPKVPERKVTWMVTRWDQDDLILAHKRLGRTVYSGPHARCPQPHPRRLRHLRQTSRTLQLTPVRKAVGDVLNRERSHEKIQTQFGGGRVLSSLPYSDLTRLVNDSKHNYLDSPARNWSRM
jgi:hypothetical protein